MPIINNVEIHYLAADPTRGKRYKNDSDNPEKWSVQLRTSDKAEAKAWTEDYGFKVTAIVPDEDGEAPYFRANLSAFTRGQDGELNRPLEIIASGIGAVDPNTVGNGSVANVRFRLVGSGDDRRRYFNGLQLTKWIKYDGGEESFDLIDQEVEIVEEDDRY